MQRCYIQDMDCKVWIVTPGKFPKQADRDPPHPNQRPNLKKRHSFYFKEMSMLATGREPPLQATFRTLKETC